MPGCARVPEPGFRVVPRVGSQREFPRSGQGEGPARSGARAAGARSDLGAECPEPAGPRALASAGTAPRPLRAPVRSGRDHLAADYLIRRHRLGEAVADRRSWFAKTLMQQPDSRHWNSSILEEKPAADGTRRVPAGETAPIRRRPRPSVRQSARRECRASWPFGGDAGAGEGEDADRQRFEQPVVALEGGGAAVARPVGLEDDLRDLAMGRPGRRRCARRCGARRRGGRRARDCRARRDLTDWRVR